MRALRDTFDIVHASRCRCLLIEIDVECRAALRHTALPRAYGAFATIDDAVRRYRHAERMFDDDGAHVNPRRLLSFDAATAKARYVIYDLIFGENDKIMRMRHHAMARDGGMAFVFPTRARHADEHDTFCSPSSSDTPLLRHMPCRFAFFALSRAYATPRTGRVTPRVLRLMPLPSDALLTPIHGERATLPQRSERSSSSMASQ